MQSNMMLRYYHPYILALYGWMYLLTAWLAHTSIIHQLRYDPLLVMPFVHLGIAAVFLLVMVFRVPIMDLWKGFNLREQFGFFLIAAAFFFSPKIIFHGGARWLDCLLALQFPLALLMVNGAGFARVFVNTLLILTAWCLENFRNVDAALITVALALLALCICFALDYYAQRYEKLQDEDLHPLADFAGFREWFMRLFKIHWTAAQIYLCTLALSLGAYWITPKSDRLPVYAEVKIEERTQQQYVQPRSLSREEMTYIVYYTGGMMIAVMGLLVLLFYVRRFQKRGGEQNEGEMIIAAAGVKFEKRTDLERLRKMTRPDSPREALLQHYYNFCEAIGGRTRYREEFQTAGEYRKTLDGCLPELREQLQLITAEFESAKYDQSEKSWEQVEGYQQLIRDCLNQSKKDPA